MKPQVEILEDRCVMSVTTVVKGADGITNIVHWQDKPIQLDNIVGVASGNKGVGLIASEDGIAVVVIETKVVKPTLIIETIHTPFPLTAQVPETLTIDVDENFAFIATWTIGTDTFTATSVDGFKWVQVLPVVVDPTISIDLEPEPDPLPIPDPDPIPVEQTSAFFAQESAVAKTSQPVTPKLEVAAQDPLGSRDWLKL